MKPFSLNIRGRIVEYTRPAVMGILNITPDSFFEGSRVETGDAIAARAIALINEGADMLDVGAYSSRPGAADVPEEEFRSTHSVLLLPGGVYRTGERTS